MSDNESDEESGCCAELDKKETKCCKDEHRKLFIFERSFIRDADGFTFAGPDDDSERLWLQFASDPARFVVGGPVDAELKPRLNFLSTDLLWTAALQLLQNEAGKRLASLAMPRPPTPNDTPLQDPLVSETLAELAAMFIVWAAAREGKVYSRSMPAIVGLLRAKKNTILQLTKEELRLYRGRSYVSLALDSFQFFKSQTRQQPQQQAPQQQAQQLPPYSLGSNVPYVMHYASAPNTPISKTGKRNRALKLPNVVCGKCKGTGHTQLQCPVPQNALAHPDARPFHTCYTCGGSGHSAKHCTSETA